MAKYLWCLLLFTGATLFTTDSYGQFRSKNSGPWGSASTWEYVLLGSWVAAVAPPNSLSGDIFIQAGHTVTVNSARSISRTYINGTLEIQAGGALTIATVLVLPGELVVNAGGVLKSSGSNNYSAEIIYGLGGQLKVLSNGKISVGTGGAVSGAGLHGYATNGSNTWENGAKFEWNSTTALPLSGLTYFPGASATEKPLLIVNNPAAYASNAGACTINGILNIEHSFSLSGGGNKTFRDGITGSGVLRVEPESGAVYLNGTAPILGGRNLQVITESYFYIPNGLTIPADSSVSVVTSTGATFTGKGTNNFTVNGTIAMGNVTIENPSGAVVINGTLKTGHTGGLEGGTISNASTVQVNTGSTIEYNGDVNQVVTSTTILEGSAPYYNIIFSGSGTKTLANNIAISNHVRISNTAIVEALSFNLGSASAAFTMDGGRLHLGTAGLQPIMAGSYNLTGGTMQFARNGSPQTIRSGAGYVYHFIDVAGDQVSSNPGADIFLAPGGYFTIKSTGRFYSVADGIQGITGIQNFVMEAGAVLMCANEEGFFGNIKGGKTPAIKNSIENVILASGSAINYNRNGAQEISTAFSYQHLILSGSGTKSPAGSLLQVRGNLTGSGTAQFIHNNAVVEMNGTSLAQTYSATNPFVFYTLKNNNAVNLIINSDLSVEDGLLFGATAKLQLNTGNVHVKSTATKTAQVGVFASAGSISYTGASKFYIERFIKTPAKWQLVSIPVLDAAQTVKSAWAEGLNAGVAGTPGIGTNITGPAGAPSFDFTSVGYSLKYWDAAMGSEGNFRFVQKKDTALANAGGYFLYVRGDRNVTAAGPFGTTTLRTSGQLFFNPVIPVTAGKYSSVGNPLASTVNLKQLTYSPGGLTAGTVIYLWDPSLSGNYTVGGYQTLTYNGSNFIITPGGSGASSYPAGGSVYNTLQSGQAFFMKDAVVTQVSFPELAKVSGSATASREQPVGWQNIRANLLTNISGVPTLVDGAAVDLSADFSNTTDSYDAGKMENSNENISFYRNNKKLVVERHALVTTADSFFLRTERLKKRSYNWSVNLQQMNENLQEAWLVDTYKNEKTVLQFSTDNNIIFTVNDSAASASINRFYIIVKAKAVLPVSFTKIVATQATNHTVDVSWEVASEVNMQHYQIESSADGRQFKTIGQQIPLFNNNSNGHYLFNDPNVLKQAVIFYRIKGLSISGLIQYSDIAKVNTAMEAKENFAAIYPNPSDGKNIQLMLTGIEQTMDHVFNVYDINGKLLHQEYATVNKGNSRQSISLQSALPAGNYLLEMKSVDEKKKISLRLLVAEK